MQIQTEIQARIQANSLFKNLQKKKYFEMLPDFKEERTRKFTTLVFTILALSFFGLFAISPTLSTIANLNKQLSDNKFVDGQLQSKINNLYLLQQKYGQLTPDLQYVFDSFPKNPQIPLLVAQIQSLAQSSNVAITGFQTFEIEIPNLSVDTKKYYAFSFNIVANGSYDSISKFIDSMVKMQRIISINSLSLSKNTGEGPPTQLNFKGTAYFKQ
ncbi:MAG: type 4a pilus biogenesis protein PilO [Patescibacteria group bacterium]|nr:type 4a pilus biogenesis protein PilO [Patescibacteria group bacterium]